NSINPFESGDAMREPIFYAAESAYNFQYIDLAVRRYASDSEWLQSNVGFTIEQACHVAEAIDRIFSDRLPIFMETLHDSPTNQWSMLPAFYFTPADVSAYAKLDPELVEC